MESYPACSRCRLRFLTSLGFLRVSLSWKFTPFSSLAITNVTIFKTFIIQKTRSHTNTIDLYKMEIKYLNFSLVCQSREPIILLQINHHLFVLINKIINLIILIFTVKLKRCKGNYLFY